MADTERAPYVPTVKEGADGRPFIVFEPAGGEIPFLRTADVILDLKPGTSIEQAGEIAAYLRRHIGGLAILTHVGSGN